MDYYNILGVSKTVSPEELKKVYRKLAFQFHPDRNPNDSEAENKLKEINEAYSVLSDPAQRQSYDRFGIRNRSSNKNEQEPFSGFPFGTGNFSVNVEDFFNPVRRRNAPRRGMDVNILVSLSLSKAIFGSEEIIEFMVEDPCPDCNGSGASIFDTCEACKGQGATTVALPNQHVTSICRQCGGMGRFVVESCTACNGKKVVNSPRSLKVTIPAGIRHGQKIVLRDQGQKGANGGRSGNIYLFVEVSYPDSSYFSDEDREWLKRLDGKSKK